MARGLKRHCLGCGVLVRGRSRCARCEPSHGEKYGPEHVRYRTALLAALRATEGRQSCTLCGRALGLDPRKINLHHERAIADGGLGGSRVLVHSKCDAKHGGETGSTYRG